MLTEEKIAILEESLNRVQIDLNEIKELLYMLLSRAVASNLTKKEARELLFKINKDRSSTSSSGTVNPVKDEDLS